MDAARASGVEILPQVVAATGNIGTVSPALTSPLIEATTEFRDDLQGLLETVHEACTDGDADTLAGLCGPYFEQVTRALLAARGRAGGQVPPLHGSDVRRARLGDGTARSTPASMTSGPVEAAASSSASRSTGSRSFAACRAPMIP